MNILIVSQCNKRALLETRRIVDQFAERCGDRVWQTAITHEGLKTLRQLLRKTARRNTAVACHWVRGKNNTELLWLVGNAAKFNDQGRVPTNTTERLILRAHTENQWHTLEDIALLAAIAALFHDFGKANVLFQKKLRAKVYQLTSEPYRHEWVSLRLFEAFVLRLTTKVSGTLLDQHWLEALANITTHDEADLLDHLKKDDGGKTPQPSPFKRLPPLAQAVGWLILTHHRLPKAPTNGDSRSVDYMDSYLTKALRPNWISPQLMARLWKEDEFEKVWQFSKGTPLQSHAWCARARKVAERALKRSSFYQSSSWMNDVFTLHMARMSLMLSDHHFSSLASEKKYWSTLYRDKQYKVFANTQPNRTLNQRLDEHLVGVYRTSLQWVRFLPLLRQSLPSITRHSSLKKRVTDKRFLWQNKAYDLARNLREQVATQGFFGLNMASTGKGKTFANAKIMYGLADEKLGCRFSVALGLRTLTLQTGDAYRDFLSLDDDDLAVLIGSQAVLQLHNLAEESKQKIEDKDAKSKPSENNTIEKCPGSESANEWFDESTYVKYEGAVGDGILGQWLGRQGKVNQLVSAPVLVSTIDHLMPATESYKGGRHIAPMLRLLTSDVVFDEPDDFSAEDLPALSRLVYWAGLLGAKIVLSSATLPPSIVEALFLAYQSGRMAFNRARGEVAQQNASSITCAWFDEFSSEAMTVKNKDDFCQSHQTFIQKRAEFLEKAPAQRLAEIVSVSDLVQMPNHNALSSEGDSGVFERVANRIYRSILALHQRHFVVHPTQKTKLSIGLVRMANINPLVAVAKRLIGLSPPKGTQLHYCVYHSQLLLLHRSKLEQQLDTVLNRKKDDAVWSHPCIQEAIDRHPEDEHIFVVLGSPVTEVGRDHSYDWAVVEPSSMRSIIQLAGRVLRHSVHIPNSPNIHLFNENVKALRLENTSNSSSLRGSFVFSRPGFESSYYQLSSKQLTSALNEDQYRVINSVPRLCERETLYPTENLVDLEHAYLKVMLLENAERPLYAARWWQHPAHWTYELQRQTPFRHSTPDVQYAYVIDDELSDPVMHYWHSNGELKSCSYQFVHEANTVQCANGVSFWGAVDYLEALYRLYDNSESDLKALSVRFGSVTLPELSDEAKWAFCSVMGFYKPLE
ncbi:type I-F CRISPR-associated helicase Cas3f [Marinibactrum halimedae]|uniref:Type I-F CRISPR-associated helicase Cas3 n=1 Tax=Marinibactrum halimedae TaxID=1444977 RepID=A0AA37WQD1_9GAMM|nr:type I-F CRISPR-associated helicase Cas3f [Marinibactrum halimedae]MCD9460216.1 type I-F CRISPR-associated helicase Cas3f [Marinibactrum halimedae]GLS27951.1 type I-F CRISPR-associated helicase Cas3 [Marinibactrum halimedae]